MQKLKSVMKALVLFIVSGLLFASCVKDPLSECPIVTPDESKVTLYVKDKNYNNISALGLDPKDENLSFRSYVPNYYYTIENIESGVEVARLPLTEVTGDEKEIELMIDTENIPDGKYRFAVWGNVSEHDLATEACVLHTDGTEDNDMYMAVDTFLITANQPIDRFLDLERVKGELLVTFNNMPDDITRINEEVDNVYHSKDYEKYLGITEVEKVFMKEEGPLDHLTTFLAPSVPDSESMLHLSLYADEDSEATVIDPIELTIRRNEITTVNVNYDDQGGSLEIWVWLDNEWTFFKELELREITQ